MQTRGLNNDDRPLFRRGLYASTYKGQDIFCSAHAGNAAFEQINQALGESSQLVRKIAGTPTDKPLYVVVFCPHTDLFGIGDPWL